MSGFQSSVQLTPAPGVIGSRASNNPIFSVVAGPLGFVAGSGGVNVGAFAWSFDGNTLTNNGTSAPAKPVGFIPNEQQGLITVYLGQFTLTVPQGLNVYAWRQADVWTLCTGQGVTAAQLATQTYKAFANLFTGEVYPAPTGSFPAPNFGTSASVTASFAGNVMTVTAVSSGVLEPGQQVFGPSGLPANTFIIPGGTGTGAAGTYFLTTTPGTIASGPVTTTTVGGPGGVSGLASFATNVMTAAAPTYGSYLPGMLIQSANVAPGTYILAQTGGTPGGAGTYTLSTAPGTIASQAVLASPFIETDWSIQSAAQVGELIKIGRA